MMEGPWSGAGGGVPTSGLQHPLGSPLYKGGSSWSQWPGRHPTPGCRPPPLGFKACFSPLASPLCPTHRSTGWLLTDPGVQLLLSNLSTGALPHQAAGLCDLRGFRAPQVG